ncbi:SPOR domain-containing protein [Kerstersia gyiorum]|uniref:Cell division protein FtsN n=1 Tax=Kerstersia gyiorum TaxID=206506 RepID=A0A4Q7MVF1_9BURK|nr:SPOR domain-containing protein [Kerstersia gyiorum]MCO7636853.1 SPOR domain-containing protein [Pseudomonas sp. S 311-6]KAB0544001.1 SPOR domain-containing protein [Kerstersia gyiorum]MCP1631730.1 cell division protein FtsN [Kerstersia gyiorum]MCP1636758.1 cell division protein FtsN [Kerstersia gyiorum]MCP1671485.1 cell division protein FtsN [Kerstersia gyiorum]
MAKRSSRSSGQGGSTIYGLLAGLLLGLVVAAVVAFYVTKAPVPFVDRAGRAPAPAVSQIQAATPGASLPDPNRGLQNGNLTVPDTRIQPPSLPSPDSIGGVAGSGAQPATQTPAPVPATPAAPSGDDLGALIASLPNQPPAPLPKPANGAAASAYFLQTGSFQVLEDAEALRARMILLGLPVQIQRAEVNGLQVNRVRVGPYTRLDEMNRVRAQLTAENISSTVVRQ